MRTNKDNPNLANKLVKKMGLANIQELSGVTGIAPATLTAANVGKAGKSMVAAMEFIARLWDAVPEKKRNLFIKSTK